MLKRLGLKSVTPWSNGRDPTEFGWVIDGENWTADSLNADNAPGNLVDVAKEEGYGDDVTGFLQDRC
jgi:hypothetical protein